MERFLINMAVVTAVFVVALSHSAPANANAGNSIDPESGYICLTLQCDFVVSRKDKNVICKKIWPANDHRRKAQLQCSRKSGGQWIPA